MSPDQAHAVLSRLVGCWEGTFRHRAAADLPFEESPGKSENRWVLGGTFVEMTLGGVASDEWSALAYIGSDRRYVLVSLEPGDRRVTIRRGEWVPDPGCLLLISRKRYEEEQRQSRLVCDVRSPGELKLELAEENASGEEFVRFRADYRTAVPLPARLASLQPRRFVIA